jgi:hypothetical protein
LLQRVLHNDLGFQGFKLFSVLQHSNEKDYTDKDLIESLYQDQVIAEMKNITHQKFFEDPDGRIEKELSDQLE